MLQGIFDSHAHYDSERFDADRGELLDSLPGAGVAAVLNAASDLPSSRAAVELAERYPYIWCSVGVHPHEAEGVPPDYLQQLAALAKAHPRVRAIGEIGLDYHYDFSPRERQRQVFEEQLQLAAELSLPVIIHSREATADTLALLGRYRPRGVVHCFSGSAETAEVLLSWGMYIGFTGVVTFKNAHKAHKALQAVPDGRLLLETDCPYMAPEPHRGKRCSSLLLPHTVQRMAELRGCEPQAVADATRRNACALFGIQLP